MRMIHRLPLIVSGCTLAALLVSVQYGHAAWTEPGNNPPNGNVAPPINESATDQVKSGGISVGSLSVDYGSSFGGNINVENAGILVSESAGQWFEAHVTDNSNSSPYRIKDSNGNTVFQIQANNLDGAGAASIEFQNASEYSFAGGGVGIGTSNPNGDLEILSGSPTIRLNNNEGGGYWDFTARDNGSIDLLDNDTNRFTILSDGKVGIGTNNPSTRLDVDGHIRTPNQMRANRYCDQDGNNCWEPGQTSVGASCSSANLGPNSIAVPAADHMGVEFGSNSNGFVMAQCRNGSWYTIEAGSQRR